MNNNQKAEYIFQQLVERGAALPHVAVLCIETALNDLDIAAQQGVQSDVCPSCGVDDWAYGDDTNTFEVCAMCGKRR